MRGIFWLAGQEIERALMAMAVSHANITFFEHHLAADLTLDQVIFQISRSEVGQELCAFEKKIEMVPLLRCYMVDVKRGGDSLVCIQLILSLGHLSHV